VLFRRAGSFPVRSTFAAERSEGRLAVVCKAAAIAIQVIRDAWLLRHGIAPNHLSPNVNATTAATSTANWWSRSSSSRRVIVVVLLSRNHPRGVVIQRVAVRGVGSEGVGERLGVGVDHETASSDNGG
jgi:hypothetical protein